MEDRGWSYVPKVTACELAFAHHLANDHHPCTHPPNHPFRYMTEHQQRIPSNNKKEIAYCQLSKMSTNQFRFQVDTSGTNGNEIAETTYSMQSASMAVEVLASTHSPTNGRPSKSKGIRTFGRRVSDVHFFFVVVIASDEATTKWLQLGYH